jgi:hypothetical protein
VETLRAPFPYWGGKSLAAPLIWDALGDVPNFVDPFMGSGAVLLARPHAPRIETINDKDGFIPNFYRAVQREPEAVADYAAWPSFECDLHARHAWIAARTDTLQARLEGDPDYYDAKIAGWWVWGLCCWIGSGWCSGVGRWQVVDGQLVDTGHAGQGINRKRPHLGGGRGITRKRPHLGGQTVAGGIGVHCAQARDGGLLPWMQALCDRLRRVRVCCGDWTRVLGPSVTWKHGLTGILLDPPYAPASRNPSLYRVEADLTADVQAWCLANGENPLLRVVLCGYAGEYDLPGWRQVAWTAQGGMGNQRKAGTNTNKYQERVWLSPACLAPQQLTLF